jgi:hypothetical protein
MLLPSIRAAACAFVRASYPSLDDPALPLSSAVVARLLPGWLVRVGLAGGFFFVSVLVESSGTVRRPVPDELAVAAWIGDGAIDWVAERAGWLEEQAGIDAPPLVVEAAAA